MKEFLTWIFDLREKQKNLTKPQLTYQTSHWHSLNPFILHLIFHHFPSFSFPSRSSTKPLERPYLTLHTPFLIPSHSRTPSCHLCQIIVLMTLHLGCFGHTLLLQGMKEKHHALAVSTITLIFDRYLCSLWVLGLTVVQRNVTEHGKLATLLLIPPLPLSLSPSPSHLLVFLIRGLPSFLPSLFPLFVIFLPSPRWSLP